MTLKIMASALKASGRKKNIFFAFSTILDGLAPILTIPFENAKYGNRTSVHPILHIPRWYSLKILAQCP
jgi:hypothetical protein